ncbi:hypothetical protein JGH11_03025 [Dysgonomonas sp. Marseille-P4677]|uniref:hypothetical protein n=1 Tax=Dysgonomonas sp. Marseille-P4677 TaxID=2364790 RepID=UPI00191492B6|nr:hypothetical protein [Dysgonomonas sp. Marseille-P4677]MBK5719839.1 hypothetical protein [Dysgonomonas sp. Marseille-P4677]
MDPFNHVLRDYDDLISSFNRSVGYFNQGLPLIAPADIRLDIRELEGSYFTYWLISLAFGLESGTSFEIDFLKGMDGESSTSHFPGFSFFNEKGENIKWMKYSSPLSDRVSLNILLETKNKSVAYAFCTLESSKEQMITANFGFTEQLEIFCNGTSIFKKQDSESLITDEYQQVLNLNPGKNRILVKIERATSN